MSDRVTILAKIATGDIFRATDAAGPVRICLTISVTENTILARSVATQELIEFDRRAGAAQRNRHGATYHYVITSVAPLPTDIHKIMLSLDQKYREGEYRDAEDPERQLQPGEAALTKEQIRGLLFVSKFYPANPLPDE